MEAESHVPLDCLVRLDPAEWILQHHNASQEVSDRPKKGNQDLEYECAAKEPEQHPPVAEEEQE